MIPPSFKTAKITPQDGDLPANRDAQRALASVLMLARQLDSQLTAAERPLEQVRDKLRVKASWQTEAKRAGLDPDEVLGVVDLLLTLRRGAVVQDSGGRLETTPTPASSISKKGKRGKEADEPGR